MPTRLGAARRPRPSPGEEVGFECFDDSGGNLVADGGLAGHGYLHASSYTA